MTTNLAQSANGLAVELRSYLSSIVAREVLSAYEGRQVARTGLRPLQLRRLMKTAREFGLAIEVQDEVVYPQRDRGKGGWSNAFANAPRSQIGDRLVYISNSDKLAKAARQAEGTGNDFSFGEHLDIPSCCQSFYAEHAQAAACHQNDFFPFFSNQQFTARPTALLNLAGQYFDASLLSHFPCSPTCTRSIEIAKANGRMIARYDRSWLGEILSVLNRAAIYTEYSGIFMLRVYPSDDPGILHYDNREIFGTSKGRIANALAAGSALQITEEHELRVLHNEGVMASFRPTNLRSYVPKPCSLADVVS